MGRELVAPSPEVFPLPVFVVHRFRSKPFRDDSGTTLGLVCPRVARDPPDMRPLPAPLVFIANVPGVAFEEVQRRSNKV